MSSWFTRVPTWYIDISSVRFEKQTRVFVTCGSIIDIIVGNDERLCRPELIIKRAICFFFFYSFRLQDFAKTIRFVGRACDKNGERIIIL